MSLTEIRTVATCTPDSCVGGTVRVWNEPQPLSVLILSCSFPQFDQENSDTVPWKVAFFHIIPN